MTDTEPEDKDLLGHSQEPDPLIDMSTDAMLAFKEHQELLDRQAEVEDLIGADE